jgi:hypothetical protein
MALALHVRAAMGQAFASRDVIGLPTAALISLIACSTLPEPPDGPADSSEAATDAGNRDGTMGAAKDTGRAGVTLDAEAGASPVTDGASNSLDRSAPDIAIEADGGRSDPADVSACPLTTCGAQCVDIEKDVANCGGCFQACQGGAHGRVDCVQRKCVTLCEANFADCDGNATNGCEADLAMDRSHCGRCGRSCLGGTCSQGRCQPFVLSKARFSASLLVEGSTLYFSEQGSPEQTFHDGTIARLDLDRPGTTTVMLSGLRNPRALAVNPSTVYWADDFGYGAAPKQPLDGGYGPLWSVNASNGRTVAVTPNRVFATSGSAPYLYSSTLQGSDVDLSSVAQAMDEIVADASYLYVFSYGVKRYTLVDSLPDPDSALTLYASGSSQCASKHENHLYWTADTSFATPASEGRVIKTPVDGTASLVIAERQGGPVGVAADDSYVYWANYFAGTVMKAPVMGGAAVVLAQDQDRPMSVAVDDTSVYWTNHGIDGSIMRIRKDANESLLMPTDGGLVGDASGDRREVGAEAGKSDSSSSCLAPRYLPCPAPDGPCTDVYTNQANCGRCGALCGWNLRCLQGVCSYY